MSQNNDPQSPQSPGQAPHQQGYGERPPTPAYGGPQQGPTQPSYGGPHQGPTHQGPTQQPGQQPGQQGQAYGQQQYGAPQYGPGQPSYGPPSGYGPATTAKPAVRPRLLWIFLAWLAFVICLAIGIFGFVGGVFSAVTDAAPAKTFKSGETATLALDPQDKPVLYAAAASPVNFSCEARDSADQPVALTKPGYQGTVSDGTRNWEYVFDVGVKTAGDYKVLCQAPADADIVFGVGKNITQAAGQVAGGVALLVIVPLVGFLVAVLVTIIVLVRRSRARQRLAGQWQPHGSQGR